MVLIELRYSENEGTVVANFLLRHVTVGRSKIHHMRAPGIEGGMTEITPPPSEELPEPPHRHSTSAMMVARHAAVLMS